MVLNRLEMSENMTVVQESARAQVAATRAGKRSAVELLEAHLEQVERLNPALNAIVSIDGDLARSEAERVDALPVDRRGPLHGLPIAIKDLANARGFRTSLGLEGTPETPAVGDDLHVARLRAAGAVVFGKTNTPPLGAGSHTTNAVFGTTRNPNADDRSAGGSSGGAAAALAAHMQPIADGSDMGGSLRNPAAFCGVVGLRPTPGVVPNAESGSAFDPLATSGPMARDVRDTALVLSVMSGRSSQVPGSFDLDVLALRSLQPAAIDGLRVAYAPDLGGRVPVEPAITRALDRLVDALDDAGADVQRDCPDLDGSDDAFRTVRAASYAESWDEVQRAHPERFNEQLTGNIESGRRISGIDVVRAFAEITRLTRGAQRWFQDVDLLIAPATQVLPFDVRLDWPHEVAATPMGDYLDWMRAAWLFTPLGIPAMSLPIGTEGALPVGAQLLAGPGLDVELLQRALAVEGLLSQAPR